jgi:PAS domain S-box-containing protein
MKDKELSHAHSLRIIRGDGNVRWVELNSVVLNWKGAPATLNFLSDLTDRRQAEEALRESEERYKALFDRSLDLVYTIDFKGRFIDANDAALNRLGYTREEIPSLNFVSLLSEDQLQPAIKILQEIRETGSGYPRNLKGEEILLEARILAVADVVEAMASHRPYRPALGMQAALDEIARNRDTLYDPEVVAACWRLINVKGFKLK